LRYTALRRSAPKFIEARTAKTVQPMPPTAPTAVTMTISTPVRHTSSMSLWAMPSSTIVWSSRGNIRSQTTSTTISSGAITACFQYGLR